MSRSIIAIAAVSAVVLTSLGLVLYTRTDSLPNLHDLGDFEGVVPMTPPVLPLKISENRRHLVDQNGSPFLVVGDTAWSLIAQLGAEDVDHYLDDRQKKGFNSIIVNLIEHKFGSNPPQSKAGLAPFEKEGEFSTPNKLYFDFAFDVVKKANDRGIVVWLAPSYLGHRGGDEGWFKELKKAGKDAARSYGRFVGERFRDLPNVVWVVGGDFTPAEDDRWTVSEIAEGIREKDDIHPMTAHGSPGEPVADAFTKARWFEINNTYSYDKALFSPLLKDYQRDPTRPFVLIESTYENEHEATPEQIRRQAYWAMLTGACGQFMGNSPIWHFDGPGVFKPKTTWQKALDQQGSWDMIRLRNVFVGRPWHKLVPDEKNRLIVEGRGEGESTATSALTSDGKLAFAYIPSNGRKPRSVAVDLPLFAGPVTARWYNPTSGRHVAIDGSPFQNRDKKTLNSPGDNGTKTNDWLLILEVK